MTRACYFEARFSLPDCAAIIYALKRQAAATRQTVVERALAYSALRVPSVRRAAEQLPDERWSSQKRERWDRLRQHAAQALSGDVPNPCEARAWHWGGRKLRVDMERAEKAIAEGRWRVARCWQPTKNKLFVVR